MSTSHHLGPVERRATADLIADLLRERIIDGTFRPGSQLAEVQLAEQLEVSRGPVREALQRLIQEGLLEGRPHRGVYVIELDEDDVVDVYRARGAIERSAASVVVARRDQSTLTRLERLVERMTNAVEQERWSVVAGLDRQFHETLVEGAGSKRLSRMFATLLAETAMCMGALETAYPERQQIADEHRALLDGLRHTDEGRVHRQITDHLVHAVEHLTGHPR